MDCCGQGSAHNSWAVQEVRVTGVDAEEDLNLAKVVFNTCTVVKKFRQWHKAISGEGGVMASDLFFISYAGTLGPGVD